MAGMLPKNSVLIPSHAFNVYSEEDGKIIFIDPLPFVQSFIGQIDHAIKAHSGQHAGLTRIQRGCLAFILMGILLTNSVCWVRFEQIGMGGYAVPALSWVFRRAKIAWASLLQMSVRVVLQSYGITHGVLVLDDTDRKRSKKTTRIACVHKLKDKESGGFVMGQNLVLLLLITEKVTIPVGVAFYQPDPVRSKWVSDYNAAKSKGIPKKERPIAPPRNLDYPTKLEIGLRLLREFKEWHGGVAINAILADALYGAVTFVNDANALFENAQVISQLRSNQKVYFRNRELSLEEYFRRYPGVPVKLRVRGNKDVPAVIGSARLHVHAHACKRFVIAVKYEGEEEYRYLFASDLSWRTEDIVRTYTLRWLIEVFFQDWKAHEGWGKLTKLQGIEGSSHGLILSLLTDHCLLLHPDQLAQLRQNKPAFTVGSLINNIKIESLLMTIREVLSAHDPEQKLAEMAVKLAELFPLMPSEKHMIGRDLGPQAPTPSLKYRAMAA